MNSTWPADVLAVAALAVMTVLIVRGMSRFIDWCQGPRN